MLAGLQCAKLLATASLVHRDLRLANFFWDKDKPFVGDLELAAKAPLQVLLQLCLLMWPRLQLRYAVVVLQVRESDITPLTDWTDGTLDADGNYTTGSDVYQLGILLEKWLSFPIAALADNAGLVSNLTKILKSKVHAHAALNHAWLSDVQ